MIPDGSLPHSGPPLFPAGSDGLTHVLYGHLDVADIAGDLALVESGGGINPLHSEGL